MFYAERKERLVNGDRLPLTTRYLSMTVHAIPDDKDNNYYGFVYVAKGATPVYTISGSSFETVTRMCQNYISRCYKIKENKFQESVEEKSEGYYTIEVDEEPDEEKYYNGTVCYVKPTMTNLVYRNILYTCKTMDYNATRLQCQHALDYYKDNNIISNDKD